MTEILQVTVDSKLAQYEYHPLQPYCITNTPTHPTAHQVHSSNFRDLENYNVIYNRRLDVADRGELLIHLPTDEPDTMKFKMNLDSQTGVSSMDIDAKQSGQQPCTIRIAYRLVMPKSGIQFVLPDDALFPNRAPQVFTTSGSGTTCSWVPCADLCGEDRVTLEMEIVCPSEFVAIAAGGLVEQAFTDVDQTHKCFKFRSDTPIHASSFGFTLAPYDMYADSTYSWITHFAPATTSAGTEASRQSLMFSTSWLHEAVKVYADFLQSPFPFPSYSQVFVDDAYAPILSYAGFSVISSDLLHDKSIIDGAFESRILQAYALAHAWVAHTIKCKSPADKWIIAGIAQYMSFLYIRHAFGANEAVYRRYKDIQYLVSLYDKDLERKHRDSHDDGSDDDDSKLPVGAKGSGPNNSIARALTAVLRQMAGRSHTANSNSQHLFNPPVPSVDTHPLYWEGYKHPSLIHSDFLRRKAGIVLHMMEQHMKAADFASLVRLVIKSSQALVSELSADAKQQTEARRAIKTKFFLKKAKSISGVDFKVFADQWIYTDAYPNISCVFRYIPKKSMSELTFWQDAELYVRNRIQESVQFIGNVTVQIHENENDNEYDRKLNAVHDRFEFRCSSSMLRNRQRKVIADEAELSLDKLLVRYLDRPIKWVSCDPQLQWFRPIRTHQSLDMLIYQARDDPSVVAQIEAVMGMRRIQKFKTESYVTMCSHFLRDTLRDTRKYFRVRVLVALFMTERSSTSRLNHRNSRNVQRYMKEFIVDTDIGAPRPNNFDDFAEHFVHRAFITGLCMARDHDHNLTDKQAVDNLRMFLKHNDNTKNAYSDVYYIHDLIRCAGYLRLSEYEAATLTEILDELHRYLEYDRVMPSYHNLITQACLLTFTNLVESGQLELKQSLDLLSFTSYGNFSGVRVVAFECMARLLPVNAAHYLPAMRTILMHESVPGVRKQMICAWWKVFDTAPVGSTIDRYVKSLAYRAPDGQMIMSILWHMLM
jgi:transcription initiation factor TFIID subunit 2